MVVFYDIFRAKTTYLDIQSTAVSNTFREFELSFETINKQCMSDTPDKAIYVQKWLWVSLIILTSDFRMFTVLRFMDIIEHYRRDTWTADRFASLMSEINFSEPRDIERLRKKSHFPLAYALHFFYSRTKTFFHVRFPIYALKLCS